MAIENARDFLDYLAKNPELMEHFRGFNLDELKEAALELKEQVKSSSSQPAMEVNQFDI